MRGVKSEQMPYGVKDFKRIRLENRYYVDKTAFIRKMEECADFLFFVRPRRFGKSLLCETLRCYYEVAETQKLFRDFQGTNKFAGSAESHLVTVKEWYDNYCFAEECVKTETLYNCDMVLYYLGALVSTGRPPKNLVDANIRSDWSKLSAILAAQRHAETFDGVLPLMRQLVDGEEVTFPLVDEFPFEDVCNEKYFKSLYYYYGLVTQSRIWHGDIYFRIPNESVRRGIQDCISGALDTNP